MNYDIVFLLEESSIKNVLRVRILGAGDNNTRAHWAAEQMRATFLPVVVSRGDLYTQHIPDGVVINESGDFSIYSLVNLVVEREIVVSAEVNTFAP